MVEEERKEEEGRAHRLPWIDELSNLFDHQIVEVGVEAVNRAIDGYRHVRLLHLVEKASHASSGNVSRPPRNGLANVAHISTILVGSVFVTQFFEHLPAARVFAFLVTVHNETLERFR